MIWPKEILKEAGIALLLAERAVHWLINLEENYDKARALFGRRKGDMSIITEVEALIKIVPQVEQVIADAKAAEQTPQVAQMITDLEAIIAEVKGLLANPTPTPTTPA
jgi:hypothetical protein